MRLPVLVQFTVLLLVGWVSRQQQDVIAYLREELAILRELHGVRLVLTDAHRRQLARAGERLGRPGLADVATLFTPDTILRWYRDLVARKYDGDEARRRGDGGRPKTAGAVADLLCRLAEENVRWGYTSLRDRLHHLGHDLGRSTVARILAERGIVPAPERSRTTRWTDFLAAHAGTLCSADFFSAEVLTWAGVVRFQVLFVLHVSTRRVELVGIRRDPSTGWMVQLARNLTDVLDGFLRGMRYLILDRDPLYSRPFRDLLESVGVKVVRLPRESPDLNAHAERWVRSVRRELLDTSCSSARITCAVSSVRTSITTTPNDLTRGWEAPSWTPTLAQGTALVESSGVTAWAGCSASITAPRPDPTRRQLVRSPARPSGEASSLRVGPTLAPLDLRQVGAAEVEQTSFGRRMGQHGVRGLHTVAGTDLLDGPLRPVGHADQSSREEAVAEDCFLDFYLAKLNC